MTVGNRGSGIGQGAGFSNPNQQGNYPGGIGGGARPSGGWNPNNQNPGGGIGSGARPGGGGWGNNNNNQGIGGGARPNSGGNPYQNQVIERSLFCFGGGGGVRNDVTNGSVFDDDW